MRAQLIAFVLTLASVPAWAQTSDPAPLPLEAQAAMRKGILAAKEQEWLIAIQSFEDARRTAPEAPEVLYNLGLAESKISGRELRAIAWFGAYLTAAPDAPNSAAVNEFIAALLLKSHGNLGRLIDAVQDSATQMSRDSLTRNRRLSEVAGLWAATGDMTAALKAIAGSGDENTDIGYEEIAEAQALVGDIAGARKSVLAIRNGAFKSSAQAVIAVEQFKAGDIAAAESAFAAAASTADHIDDNDSRNRSLNQLGVVQARVGDVLGAQRTADLIRGSKVYVQTAIVTAKRTAGDIVGARRTVDLMPAGTWKEIARTQDWVRFPRLTRSHSRLAVRDWTGRLDDDGSRQSFNPYDPTDGDLTDWCPLNADPFLNLASHLKSVSASKDPDEALGHLYSTAKTIVMAQHVIERMLELQAKQ